MKHRWIRALALQIAEMLAVGALAALAEGWGSVPRGAILWGVAPVAGLLSACQAVRRGLNSYLALLPPAPCMFITSYLLWRFSPPAGPALLTALLSLVGAAAGEELTRRGSRTRPRRHKRS